MELYLTSNLKWLRRKNKITQATLAQKLEVGNTTISNWEKGIAEPSYAMLSRIAQLYGVVAGDIISINMETSNAPPLPENKPEQKTRNAPPLPDFEKEKKTSAVKPWLNEETKSTNRGNLIGNPKGNLIGNPLAVELQIAREKIQELKTQLRNCKEQGQAIQLKFEQAIRVEAKTETRLEMAQETIKEKVSLVEQHKAEAETALHANGELKGKIEELEYQYTEMYKRLKRHNDTEGLQANAS